MQRTTQGLEEIFELTEESLQEGFLMDLFHGEEAAMPGRTITVLLVKHAGFAILDPT